MGVVLGEVGNQSMGVIVYVSRRTFPDSNGRSIEGVVRGKLI